MKEKYYEGCCEALLVQLQERKDYIKALYIAIVCLAGTSIVTICALLYLLGRYQGLL